MGQLLPHSFAGLKPLGFVPSQLSTTEIDTLDIPEGAKGALVQVTGGNAYWTDSGTAPSAVVGSGMVLAADAEPVWFGLPVLAALQFVGVGSDTHLLVSFYG